MDQMHGNVDLSSLTQTSFVVLGDSLSLSHSVSSFVKWRL